MSEHQIFGFFIQDKLIEEYNLMKDKSYTGVYDAFTKYNMNIQIKTNKNKTAIYMGDIKRNFSKDEPFILIIYNYDSNYNHIKTYFILVDDYKKYNELFYFDEYDEFCDEFKNISNSHEDDSKWKLLRLKYTKRYKEKHKLTRMNPKRDHKKQKRIQCSIPYKFLKEFMDNFKVLTEEEFNNLNLKGELK